MVGALVSNLRGKRRYLEGASTLTQQLARNFFLTEELAREAATGQRSLAPQAARAVHVAHPRAQGDEGRDPRAVPERRVPRAARLVRRARRRGSVAPVLRQGRQQPLARRGGHDRRDHPVPGRLVALPLAGARPRAPQRRAARDGRRRLHLGRRRRAREQRARAGGAARARVAGAVLRGPGRPDARRAAAGPGRRHELARRLHDARHPPAAGRAGRAARRASCGSTRSSRAASGSGRRRPR